ncbi:MAG: hypothetical protein ACTSRU_10970 [Candidatus Hodarchaeales archaeon]
MGKKKKNTKSKKYFNDELFTVVGWRTKQEDAQKLAKETRKTHLARVLPNKDARGNPVYLVWGSKRKKRLKKRWWE